MKKLLLSFAVLFVTQIASATDGLSTGCFDIAVSVFSKMSQFGIDGDQHLIKTGAMICTTEKNIKYTDDDQIGGTGEITVRIFDNGKVVSLYNLGAISADAAAGTSYISYALTQADFNTDPNDPGANNYKLINFKMRNDHIKKGQYAGRVELFGQELALIQR
ncbi:MAG: hypothetical protein K2P92_08775 [Bdellovibrionaceae bacterium]|nr:hypothetical protein [Pseudobdellovibrionaceae bacterium]